MSTLVLVRHGQSAGNERNEFTGWRDVALTPQGQEASRTTGLLLREYGLCFDHAFSSNLARAIGTCQIILAQTNESICVPVRTEALNERNYGVLTGLNKDKAREKWGDDQVQLWRRSYLVPPPCGESIRDTSARALPFIICEVSPLVLRGETILLVSHSNTLRTICRVIERLSINEMLALDIPTSTPTIYHLARDLSVKEKTVLPRSVR